MSNGDYPNMSNNPYDYDFYFLELSNFAKDKESINIKTIKSLIGGITGTSILALPFYINYPFLTFIQQVITWPVVIITIMSMSVVYGSEGNYFTNTLKESIKKGDYKYLLSQINGGNLKDFYKFLTSTLLEIYIVLFTYIAYTSYFFFGLNYVLAGCFFLSAIAIKSGVYNSWKNIKKDLKTILREEDILIEDLVKKVENWKVIN